MNSYLLMNHNQIVLMSYSLKVDLRSTSARALRFLIGRLEQKSIKDKSVHRFYLVKYWDRITDIWNRNLLKTKVCTDFI